MNPDNAKADALNGVNPLGDGGSMIDKTSRMDKELDMENATSTFNGNGERGVLSSKLIWQASMERQEQIQDLLQRLEITLEKTEQITM